MYIYFILSHYIDNPFYEFLCVGSYCKVIYYIDRYFTFKCYYFIPTIVKLFLLGTYPFAYVPNIEQFDIS